MFPGRLFPTSQEKILIVQHLVSSIPSDYHFWCLYYILHETILALENIFFFFLDTTYPYQFSVLFVYLLLIYFWEQNWLPCKFMNFKSNSCFVKISVLDVLSQQLTLNLWFMNLHKVILIPVFILPPKGKRRKNLKNIPYY